jgi:hypothetical protein
MRPNFLSICIGPAVVGAIVGAAVAVTGPTWWPAATIPTTAPAEIVKSPPTPAPALAPGATSIGQAAANDAQTKPAGLDNKPWWDLAISHLAWPLTLLFALAFIAYNSRLSRIFGAGTRLIRKISAGGVEIEINSETIEVVQKQLHGTFQDLVNGAAYEYERMASIQNVPTLLKNIIENHISEAIPDVRATVHISDVIFPEFLYQLVDYYPNGAGANRRFSQRFGIIGRSWRSKKSHGTGNAFAGAGSVDALVENWGMTPREAHGQVHARPACLSIVICDQNIAQGILFVDSTQEKAFGDDENATRLAETIAISAGALQLGAALAKTIAPLKTAAPTIVISDPIA